jgi:hypothetical protein
LVEDSDKRSRSILKVFICFPVCSLKSPAFAADLHIRKGTVQPGTRLTGRLQAESQPHVLSVPVGQSLHVDDLGSKTTPEEPRCINKSYKNFSYLFFLKVLWKFKTNV